LSPKHFFLSLPKESNLSGKKVFFSEIKGHGSPPLRRDGTREVSMKPKDSILAHVVVLALIGILAGVLGGLGVGVITGHSASSTTSQ